MAGGDAFPAAFLDFSKAQAEANLTTPKGFKTDGSPIHRHLWSRFFTGEGANVERIQYGSFIKYQTILSARSSGEAYKPGGIGSPSNTQHLVNGTAYWRFYRWNKSYNDKELKFNGNGPLTKQWADLWAEKQAVLDQDVNDFMEERFFAVPYKGLMEGSGDDAVEMYSLFAHINEDTSGLFGTNWTGQTWTTKQGLDPTTASYGDNMKPQRKTYSNYTPGSSASLLSAFHSMSKAITWTMPKTMNAYWESEQLNKQVILTDEIGHTVYQNIIQSTNGGQDLFLGGKQDGSVPDPQYYGIPITWSDKFGQAAVYDDGSNGLKTAHAGAGSGAKTGPRFVWANGNYLTAVLGGDSMFVESEPLRDPMRPDTWVIWVTLDCNFICTSYKRQGIVYPAADL